MARSVARFIRDASSANVAYTSDREHVITSLLEEAIRISGRQGIPTETEEPSDNTTFPVDVADNDEPDAPTVIHNKPQPQDSMVAAPELTHPGESQSNGLAERAGESVVDHTRTIMFGSRDAFEDSHPLRAPCDGMGRGTLDLSHGHMLARE